MTQKTPILVSCHRCTARVLEVRWDWQLDTLIGRPLIDPVELTADQITACVLIGRDLWQIHEWGGRYVTSHRSRWWPRKPIDGYITPEHACGTTWDATPVDLTPLTYPVPDECPF